LYSPVIIRILALSGADCSILLIEGMVRAVPEDGLVGLDDVAVETSSPLYRMWEQQQRLL